MVARYNNLWKILIGRKRTEKQPKKKFELVQPIKRLKKEIELIK